MIEYNQMRDLWPLDVSIYYESLRRLRRINNLKGEKTYTFYTSGQITYIDTILRSKLIEDKKDGIVVIKKYMDIFVNSFK